ncbi:MAG: nitrophenyl compound nitroreductase subunit ArsF family protein [Lentisphaeria bacterium]|nr:nitrophenyl compound nitroreductase subunit ArsF family protein [Lentisphaeria bacterium]
MVLREFRGKAAAASENNTAQTAPAVPVNEDTVTVYYFHGNTRCQTCNKFEKLTSETVQKRFADQLANGSVALKIINRDLPENEHYIKDFLLTSNSVVLQKGDQVKNLEEIWTIIRQSDDEFMAYLEREIKGLAEAQ